MERSWLHARVVRSVDGLSANHYDTLTTLVPALVAQLRDGDPGGHWYFNRPPERHLDLGFFAADPVLTELDTSLRTRRPCSTSGARRPWITDAAHVGPLAEAGSDLALGFLAAGGLPEQDELPLWVQHLRDLVQLVHPADRLGFLSMYWQHQARAMTVEERRELAVIADGEADKIVIVAEETRLAPTLESVWRSYLDTVHTILGRKAARGEEPVAYLIFHHLRLTRERLGLRPSADALAALALRIALGRDAVAAAAAAAASASGSAAASIGRVAR
jgi:hypothetical protein